MTTLRAWLDLTTAVLALASAVWSTSRARRAHRSAKIAREAGHLLVAASLELQECHEQRAGYARTVISQANEISRLRARRPPGR